MANDPVSPQQLIDDAAKALEKTPGVLDVPAEPSPSEPKPVEVAPPMPEEPVAPPPMEVAPPEPPAEPTPIPPEPAPPVPEPTLPAVEEVKEVVPPHEEPLPPPPMPEPVHAESMIIPPKETEEQTSAPPSPIPPKEKKKGKGVLVATLLFFIFTLPIAIYYVTQSPQFAEIRSRASTIQGAGTCEKSATYLSGGKCSYAGGGVVCSTYNNIVACNAAPNNCCTWTPRTVSTTTTETTTSSTPTIIARGCIGGDELLRTVNGVACRICSYGGSLTCNGPSGGTLGDPCTVKYSDNSIKSVACGEIGMLRCNCGGDSWVGGWAGVSCSELCACAGLVCDQCTPTPTTPKTNTPTVTPTTGPTNTPTATPTVTPTSGPTSTPVPGTCDASCEADSNCESGLSCVTSSGVKRCRKSACPDESDCSCPGATATPTTYNTPTPTRTSLIVTAATPTPSAQPTPKIPVAGVGPGLLGAMSVVGSVVLLLLGLIL